MVIRAAGVSLIELMAVVALIGLIMFVAIPYTAEWVNATRVGEARSLLLVAHREARSMAMRNLHRLDENDVPVPCHTVAWLTKADGELILQAYAGDVGDPCCPTATGIWQSHWPHGVDVLPVCADIPNDPVDPASICPDPVAEAGAWESSWPANGNANLPILEINNRGAVVNRLLAEMWLGGSNCSSKALAVRYCLRKGQVIQHVTFY